MLRKVISGGQIGADQAGLEAAQLCGLETGGYINRSFKTKQGLQPELGLAYGLIEIRSDHYPDRIALNVERSDATVRFATNFHSRGELCTLKFIYKYGKPYLDIDMTADDLTLIKVDAQRIADFIIKYNVTVLNVAGNADEALEHRIKRVLMRAFLKLTGE